MRLSPIFAIAYRDLLKLLRDPVRIVFSLIFPVIFIVILGPAGISLYQTMFAKG